MIVDINLPRVTRYQHDAIFAPERNVSIEATTKAGKTFGCMLWILHEASSTAKPGECWWVAPIAEQAGIAYRRTCELLRKCDPEQRFWSTNKTSSYITLANGNVIRYKGSDDPDSLYGEDVFAAVIDEASRCKEEAWHAVRSTLTATKGRLRIIGNVKGRQNWAYKIARRAESGMPDWKFAKITCYDAVKAGVIDAAEIESARSILPEQVFRELYEGIPSDDGGNPFGLSHIAKCVGQLSTDEPVCYGIDLAKSVDWTVVIGLDVQHRVCRFERWQSPWRETIARIKRIIGCTPTLVDSTGVGDPILEELQHTCPQVQGYKFTSASKQQLMEGLAVAIQHETITYPDGVIRNELDVYGYEYTRTGVRYTAPEGMHDDCVCSLALAEHHANTRPIIAAGWSDISTNANIDHDRFFGEQ